MDSFRVLSWNLRGSNSKKNQNNLRMIIKKWETSIVCIQETKCQSLSDMELEIIWGTDSVQGIFQEAIGRSGGLCTLWDSSLFSNVGDDKHQNWIWSTFKVFSSGIIVHLLNIYAPLDRKKKEINV